MERLITNEAVQEDLKVTEKQKTQIKALTEQVAKKRAQFQANLPKMIAQASAAANAAAAEAAAANGIPFDPNAGNNNGGRGGNNGGRGGPGGGNNMDRQLTRQAMTEFQNGVDTAYLKLLDARQKTRVKQITLQSEGTRAFTNPNPEVVDKLAITDDQFAEIKAVTDGLRQAQRASMQQVMASIVPPADPNAAANNGGNNQAGGNNPGGPGGRGGRGGFPNMANMDDATRTKFFQTMQDVRTRQTSETMAAIGKILTKAQKATYNRMIGEPFDLAKLRGPGGPGGPPGGPGGPPTSPGQTATAKAATPAAPAATTRTAPARKSLRESRGGN